MARYFDGCSTVEELKKAYRAAAMEHHPDQGGTDADMMEVNRQYEEVAARIAKGGKAGGSDPSGYTFDPAAYKAAVMAAVKHPDVILELVGRWLWASGNTFAHKEELKAAGYQWSHKHRAWYYRDDADICTRGGKKTLEEIKAKYGSERIVSNDWSRATLTA